MTETVPSTTPAPENPYVGPRPFKTSEGRRFFGRDLEARELVALVASERLVLFYAQSGAGKSSLINARVLPAMAERGFAILPVGRVSGQAAGEAAAQKAGAKGNAAKAAASAAATENIFIYNLLLSLDSGAEGSAAAPAGQARRLARLTLAGYLGSLPTEEASPAAAAVENTNQMVESGLQPLLLVIDQFEEIFTTHPEAWNQREGFFIQLAEAMQRDPNLWVVLVIREDYVAALDPYARLAPNHLRARYYMERMGYEAALEAVKKPAETLRPFDPQVAEKLVDNLRLVAAGETRGGQPQYVEGQYVEPVQLQVVCMQLWENLKDTPGHGTEFRRITAEDLNRLARGEDQAQYVSRALADFYEQAVARVVQEPTIKVSERELRDWFSRELITEAGTRGFAFQGDEKTGSLPNAAVRLLEGQFIVRSETRAAGKWYELVHDRFVAPILEANRRWREAHSSPVAAAAADWLAAGRDEDRLYEGKQLEAALAQLDGQPETLGEEEQEFIRASRDHAEAARARRQKRTTAVGIGLTALFAILAVLAVLFAIRAQRNADFANFMSELSYNAARTAEAASVNALVEQANAETARDAARAAQQTAEQSQQTAEAAQAEAVYQRDLVATEQARTEVERQLAQSGQLAALADYYRESRPDLARLLSVEAYRASDGWVSRKALFNGLRGRENVQISRESPQLFRTEADIYSLAFSPDGAQFVTGRDNGKIDLWDADRQAPAASQPPADFFGTLKIYTQEFDRTGDLLAAGGEDRVIKIWNRKTGKVNTYPGCRDGLLTRLAFQHKGPLLAATCSDGGIVLLDTATGTSTSIPQPGLAAWSAVWLLDDARLAAGYSDGAIRVWNLANQINPQILRVDPLYYNDKMTVRSLALSADGRYLYSANRNGNIRFWDLTTGEMLLQSDPNETPDILSIALSGDEQLLVTGNAYANLQRPVTIWDAKTLKPIDSLTGHTHWVMAVAINPQDTRLATAGLDGSVILWKLEGQSRLGSVFKKVDNVEAAGLGIGAAGAPLLAARQNGVLSAFDLSGRPGQARITQAYTSLAVVPPTSSEPSRLALGGADGTITLFDSSNGQPLGNPIRTAGAEVTALAAWTGGENTVSMLAAASCVKVGAEGSCDESAISLWNIATGEALLTAPLSEMRIGRITSLAINRLGTTLMAGGQSGAMVDYAINKEKTLTPGPVLQNHTAAVTSLAFSPASELLAVGMDNGMISLWDGPTHRLIGDIAGSDRQPLVGLVFRRAGEGAPLTLLAAHKDGLVMEWDADFASWAKRNCALAGRDMNQEEWAQFALPGAAYRNTCE